MTREKITVETRVAAPVDEAWDAYTSPDRIMQWNFASDDWQCPAATVDLREGGSFSSRMEAKDGSFGFDFEGVYTKIITNKRIEYDFGDRHAVVAFTGEGDDTRVIVSFDSDGEYPIEQQRDGWQAILHNFAKHVKAFGAVR